MFETRIRRRAKWALTALCLCLAVDVARAQPQAATGGVNVNVIAGTGEGGDWTAQRQNEPSMACSSRNPQNCLAGANDYRSVDLPFPNSGEKITGDAWLGWYTTKNGGLTWRTRLLPGFPQDTSAVGLASPLRGYGAGADPIIRPGSNGLFYYGGLVFDRTEGGGSAIFVARFIDNNNQSGIDGEPIAYLGASIVHRLGEVPSIAQHRAPNGSSVIGVARRPEPDGTTQKNSAAAGAELQGVTQLVDKPWIAVDVPRASAQTCAIGGPGTGVPLQTFPGGRVYMVYALFDGLDEQRGRIMFSRSDNCGATWSSPRVISRVPSADINDDGVANLADVYTLLRSWSRRCGHALYNANADLNNDCVVNATDLFLALRALGQPVPSQPRLSQGATVAIDPRNGAVQIAWRQFHDGVLPNAIVSVRSTDGGASFSAPTVVAVTNPFDQGTTNTSFRTNAFPTMTFDAAGRAYLAWSARGYATQRPDPLSGDARIVLSTSTNGATWAAPVAVDNQSHPGHQIMPGLNFAQGKLQLVYYDLREDVSQLFGPFVDELPILTGPAPRIRHTIDVRAALANPGATPAFNSFRLSQYRVGGLPGSQTIQQLEFNPPNLPLFRAGTSPFLGDYLDTAASSAIVRSGSTWAFNTAPAGGAVYHAIWTDNRDVRPPANGDWTAYTAPDPPFGRPTMSTFDPALQLPLPPCVPGQAGMRNQNIYTARITEGLVVGALTNSLPLDTIQRSFPVYAQNNGTTTRSYRLAITNQPLGGQASFKQFELLTSLDVQVPPKSTVARTVFAQSSVKYAQINVSVTQIDAPGGTAVPNGQTGNVILNPDPENPDPENPDIENPDIENPDIENAEVYNPDIENAAVRNPDIENPDIENPDIENPDPENITVANPNILNPDIENPDIENPDIENPDIENPDIENADLVNGSLSDTTWTVTNTGNAPASFTIRLSLTNQLPTGFKSQLIAHKIYQTPTVLGCELLTDPQTVLLANVPNPTFVSPSELTNPDIENPDPENVTLALAPGETARITLRVLDPNRFDTVTFRAADSVAPAVVAQAVSTPEADQGITQPAAAGVLVSDAPIPGSTVGGTYSTTLQSVGSGTWTVAPGSSLPPGLSLNSATGVLSGTPTTTGVFTFTLIFQADSGLIDSRTMTITVGAAGEAADLSLSSPAPQPVALGGNLVYTMTVTNFGPLAATNVVLNDTLPEGATFVSVTTTHGTCQQGNGTLNCQLGTLPIGVSATVVLTVTPKVNGSHVNEVQVLADQADPVVTNNAAETTGTTTGPCPAPCADLAISKADSPDPVVVGSQLTYTLTVTNAGPDGATNVMVTDILPSSVTLVSATSPNGSCTGTTTVTCALGSLGNGASATVTIVVTPTSSTTINNTASVAAAGTDPAPANNTAEAPTVVAAFGACTSATFSGPHQFAIGATNAVTVDTGDFNKDGHLDAVVTSGAGNAVALLLGDGLGGFTVAPTSPFTVGTSPGYVVAADFNNDTNLDVVVTNSGSNNVSILLGDGNGGFAPAVNFATSLVPFTAATADLDGDTDLDLVVGSTSGSNVAVLLGDGTGQFGAATFVPSGPNPLTVVLEDFDANGTVDIAVPNQGSTTVSVLLGNGSGGFAAPTTIAIPTTVARVRQLGDVNGDGKPDLGVTASPSNTPLHLDLLLNTSAGGVLSFGAPVEIISAVGVGHTAGGDFNGDGKRDLAAISFATNSLQILFGNGDGTFGTPVSYAIGTSQNHFSLGDVNGDGRLDIVGTRPNTGNIYVLLNTCGALAQADVETDVVGPASATAGDTLGYIVTATNHGPAIATGVVITTVVPVGMNLVALDSGTAACTSSAGTVACTLNSLAVNETATLTLTVNAFAAGARLVRATVTAGESDSTPADNTAEALTNVAAGPVTFVVTNTDDSGTGSLRQAILDSNLNVGSTNTIRFEIPGTGPFTIAPLSGLPQITVPVVIDGTTQAGYTGTPIIELSGLNAGSTAGLGVRAGGSTIRGLVINRFAFAGIRLDTADGNVVERNYIGTNIDGTAAAPNQTGINVISSNNTIGGTTAGAGNLVSGNTGSGINIGGLSAATPASGNVISGNFIGITASGLAPLANGTGVSIGSFATTNAIGGTVAAARNVIAGNTGNGISVGGGSTSSPVTDNVIQGNFIGTSASGLTAVANGFAGITVAIPATNTRVGGSTAASRNVISGNLSQGVAIQVGSVTTLVENNYIGTDLNGTSAVGNLAAGVRIETAGNTIARNLISGGAGLGMNIDGVGANGNVVIGNLVGTNAAGTAAVPNATGGINITSANNTIGGTTAADRNVISGNPNAGISINGATATGNLVLGNFIGTNIGGTAAMANGSGVFVSGGATNNIVGGTTSGARNLISGNNGDGIAIAGAGTSGNVVQGNFIGTDVAGTVDLGNLLNGVEIFNGAAKNEIGATSAAARNVISGSQFNGVIIIGVGSNDNIVQGNYIGTDLTGTAPIPNNTGLQVSGGAANNTIGGSTPGAGNLISGNGEGVFVSGAGTTGNVFHGNHIGTNAAGTAALANGNIGLVILSNASNNTVGGTSAGMGNVIAFNAGVGVVVRSGINPIRGNAIFSNNGLGIDLDGNGVTLNDPGDDDVGPNNFQNFPVLTAATNGSTTTVAGTLNSTANTTFTVELFSNSTCDSSGFGEGAAFIGSAQVTTDAVGNAVFSIPADQLVPIGQFVTATATGSSGNTSEFSACVQVAAASADLLLTKTDSADPVVVNTNLTYTLTVTNIGPDAATNVTVTDTLPLGVTFVSATPSTGSCAGTSIVQCSLGSLINGASATVTIVVTPTSSGPLSNTASVSASQNDPVPGNNADGEDTIVAAFGTCTSPSFAGPFQDNINLQNPSVIAAGDFNSDGAPDAAVAGTADNAVRILLSGPTANDYTLAVGSSPSAIVAAHFNNDSNLDLAVNGVIGGVQRISILLGNGDGTFAAALNFDAGVTTATFEAADLDGDTDLDLVIGSGSGSNIAVLLGNGNGTFSSPTLFASGQNPFNIVLADFDGNGTIDLAVPNANANSVSVLSGNGDGTFGAATVIPIPTTVVRLRRFGDVNGDGKPDLGVTTGTPANLQLLRNTSSPGTVSFAAPVEIIPAVGVGFTAPADFNIDGRVDLAAVSFQNNSVMILFGNGDGTFLPPMSYAVGTSQNDLEIIDIDGDGRLDIVGTRPNSGNIYYLQNTCGNPAVADLELSKSGPTDLSAGDQASYTVTVTNHGPAIATDIVVTDALPAGLTFLSVDASGALGAVCSDSVGTVTCELATLDVDAQAVFVVNARALGGGVRVNRATVTAAQSDSNPSNNNATVTTTVAAAPITFVVANTNNSGAGSLRQAILDSNSNTGSTNTIEFDIPGTGPFTIAPSSALPAINVSVVIDGTTQNGFSGTPIVELSGVNAGSASGLNIIAGNSTVRGLVVNRFGVAGIRLAVAGGNLVEGNYLGTNIDGTAGAPNQTGINIVSSNNTIGGTTAAARNVISGNTGTGINLAGATAATLASGNTIVGNFIGTNASGSGAVPNGTGVSIGGFTTNNTIGGTTIAARNVISGNGGIGVLVGASGAPTPVSGNAIEGNFVGTDVNGLAALANAATGINIGPSASNTRIGGTTTSSRNVLSGNLGQGALIQVGSSATTVENNYIGTNLNGTGAVGNAAAGIRIDGAGNTIARNVISGGGAVGVFIIGAGATGNVVVGNFVGTNAAGTAALPNASDGISNSGANNRIGGTTAADRNLISGNIGAGLSIVTGASSTLVQGNFIGTDVTGTNAVPNQGLQSGVFINGSPNNTIGGSAPGAGNLISGNAQHAITVVGANATGNVIQGNLVGVDATGLVPLANGGIGVDIVSALNNTVGGSGLARNVISGNGLGIQIRTNASGNIVQSNLIGTDVNGTAFIASNGNGVHILDASNNTIGGIGAGNTIAGSGGDGINVSGATSIGNALLGNAIFSNGGLGIDLNNPGVTPNDAGDADAGPNNYQNFPVLTVVGGGVQGTLNSTPNTTFRIEFFASTACDGSGNGEGAMLLGAISVTTDGTGNATIPFFAASAGQFVTATATDPSNNTSEFSACAQVAVAAPFVVTNTDDSGTGSLRQAILNANATPGADVISFAIPGSGVHTIAPTSALPIISEAVTIDGTTRPGFAGTPLIELDGSNVSTSNGLVLDGSDSIVRGLVINRFTSANGIVLQGGGNHRVEGNFIGTNAAGAAAAGNVSGVLVLSASNVIGGTTPGTRNTLSGNTYGVQLATAGSTGNFVQGNFIGTDSTGTLDVGNTAFGVLIFGSGNVVGGTTVEARNVISGNDQTGIRLLGGASSNSVQGNFIGTDAAGTTPLANGVGLNVGFNAALPATNNTIGGTEPGAGNLIAFNTGTGLTVPAGSVNNAILGNSIHDNGALGIDLDVDGVTANDADETDDGGNHLQNFPVLSPATDGVQGTFNSTPGTTFRIEFFGNPSCDALGNGEGTTFLGAISRTTDDAGNATIPFFAATAGTFITATATDPSNNTSEFSACVQVPTENQPPVANAGPDQNVPLGATVQLDGSGSFDPEEAPLSYTWILNTRPAGSNAVLSAADIVNPTFIADVAGTYIAQLVVNDGQINGQSDTVTITTQNSIPIANAGADQSNLALSATVNLNGNGSSDPDGDQITFLWSFVLRPPGSTAQLSNATSVTPSFVIDTLGRYRVQLVVNDGQANSLPDTVDIVTVNQPPIANAGVDQSVIFGSTVFLNGNGSSDPDANPLTYSWSFTQRPAGSAAALSGATSATPTFVADVAGEYTVQLVVNDGVVDSTPDSVGITATTNNIQLALVGTPLLGVGRQTPLRITLPSPAPSGGVTVTVTSDDTDVVTVGPPSTAFIESGTTVGQVMLNGISVGSTTVRASTDGFEPGSLGVTVTQNLISTPALLNVALGQTSALPITIGPSVAPPGGLVVDLVSANPGIIEVITPQVTVPEGALSANATVRGASAGTAAVTTSRTGYASATTSVTSAANLDILSSSVSFNQGLSAPTVVVQLESAGAAVAAPSNLTVNLTSADTACVTVPATITILAGQVSAFFQPAYGGTASTPCTTTVTASAVDITPDSMTVTVNPPPAINISGTQTVGAGLQSSEFASLGTSQHGGVTVTVTSSDPTRVLVSPNGTTAGTASFTLNLSNGQTSVPYHVQGLENITGSATVTISAPGFTSATQTVNVVAIGIEIQSLTTSTTTLSVDETSWWIQVGLPNASNTALSTVQNVRAGGPQFVFTLTNSNAAVAQLKSDQPVTTGQTVTKPILPNVYYPQAVSGGISPYGLAFDPLGVGTTNVTVTGPAGVMTMSTTGTRTVTVTGPAINIGGTQTVGAGLQSSEFASLGASQHGGVTVTVTSSDPTRVLVSPNGTTAGTASFTLNLNNGQTSVPYHVQGLENITGSATVTISAPGFTSATQTVNVVAIGIEIQSLTTSTTTLSVDETSWWVQVGVPNASNTALSTVQNVRAGGPQFVFMLTNSNAAVAQLKSDQPAATGQTVTKPILPNVYYPQAVSGGISPYGLAFDPIGNGTTTVTVTGPAGVLTMSNTGVRTVTVTTAAISLASALTLGAGLQSNVGATLGASQHGGVTVTVSSSAPSLVLVSPDAVTAGSGSINVSVANGFTSVPFHVQGLENVAGTAVVSVSAPGFTTATMTVTVTATGIEIQSLTAATTTLSADDTSWWVQVGVPNASNTALSTVQNVRAGGPQFVFMLTNSNAAVAQLKSDQPAATGQTVTKPILPNVYYPQAVSGGISPYGLAFDPIGNGTTTVTVTGPAGVVTMSTTGARSVTVSAPGITINSTGATIGAGLQNGFYTATLGGSQHGGVTMRIASSDPTIALVSPNATTPGTAFIDIPLDNGLTTAFYYLQGTGVTATGDVTITASAPGFTNGSGLLHVVPSGLRIESLSTSIAATAANNEFYISIGVPNVFSTNLADLQNVRAGSSLTVTVTTSDPTVAQLVTLAGGADTRTVVIPANQYWSPTTVATGGVALDPLTAGNTMVEATIPGVITTAAGRVTVQVTGSGASVGQATSEQRVASILSATPAMWMGAVAFDSPVEVRLHGTSASSPR